MASSLNADNGVISGSAGLKSTADSSGVLALQTNGTTGLTLNTTQALGVGTSPSYGTSGQVLTSAGSGAAPTWTTPSAGGMTLLATLTPSGVNTIVATNLASSKSIVLLINATLASAGDSVYIECSVNNGASYGRLVPLTASAGTAKIAFGQCYNTNINSTKIYFMPSISTYAETDATVNAGTVNAIRFSTTNGSGFNFTSGSIWIYGVN